MSNESGAVLTQSEEETEDQSAPMTMEDYLHFEEEAFKTPNHGDIVDGIVVRVDPDEVLVDIGAKAEGVISSKELGLRGEADSLGLEPGDQIKVFVLQPENEEGNVVLSLRRARAETTWLVAAEKQTDGSVIDADVREQNKGGLIVNVLGLRGFLPSSQVARAYAGSLESLVGQRIAVKILEVNRKRNRLIVSQKAAEDEDRARKREELFSRLQTGSTVKGTVSGITSYGAFVDIGGADGLIHISELSWDRVSKVTDVLQLGEEVTVKVIKLDPEQTRISLSLRQLQQDPWEKLVQSMPIGSIVEGQVTKTKKYGAFLQIMAGIEGLLHISELSWDHVERTEDVLKVGETLQVKVIGIDTARRRISGCSQASGARQSLQGGLPERVDGQRHLVVRSRGRGIALLELLVAELDEQAWVGGAEATGQAKLLHAAGLVALRDQRLAERPVVLRLERIDAHGQVRAAIRIPGLGEDGHRRASGRDHSQPDRAQRAPCGHRGRCGRVVGLRGADRRPARAEQQPERAGRRRPVEVEEDPHGVGDASRRERTDRVAVAMPPCAVGDDADHNAERDHAQDALRHCDVEHTVVDAIEGHVRPCPLAGEKSAERDPRRVFAPAGQRPRDQHPERVAPEMDSRRARIAVELAERREHDCEQRQSH